jgi:hypothetical protein|tara:strand:+ start:41 stop:226 length:186 start_codon:yes stop_codon:yes gene_type:complete
MRVDDLDKLKINQQVKVRLDDGNGFIVGEVKSINDWKKLVGVVDLHGEYKEYPPRLILNCL